MKHPEAADRRGATAVPLGDPRVSSAAYIPWMVTSGTLAVVLLVVATIDENPLIFLAATAVGVLALFGGAVQRRRWRRRYGDVSVVLTQGRVQVDRRSHPVGDWPLDQVQAIQVGPSWTLLEYGADSLMFGFPENPLPTVLVVLRREGSHPDVIDLGRALLRHEDALAEANERLSRLLE